MKRPTMQADRSLTGTAPKRPVVTRAETMQSRLDSKEKARPSQADLEFVNLQAQIDSLIAKKAALTGRVLTREDRGDEATKSGGAQADVSNVSRTSRNP